MSLFSELKRRNVFRVALLYVVASWIVLQVADVGISLLGLPVNAGRLIFLLLAAGLPLVLIFSWVYEITPEGLKKEKDTDRSLSVTDRTAKKLDATVIVLLVIGIGALALDRFVPERTATPADPAAGVLAAKPEKSIAAERSGDALTERPVQRFTIDLPSNIRDSRNTYTYNPVTVTPDGRRVIFRASLEGKWSLFSRAIDSLVAEPIRGSERVAIYALSPDGEWIVFF